MHLRLLSRSRLKTPKAGTWEGAVFDYDDLVENYLASTKMPGNGVHAI